MFKRANFVARESKPCIFDFLNVSGETKKMIIFARSDGYLTKVGQDYI